MRLRAFRAAFPLTAPIAAGFLFLGCSYGLLMHAKGFAFWYPVGMAFFIFAGSMEFVTVNLLLSAFNPVAAFLLALMVNARHLFYGLSMLGKLRNMGWKKPYLIFAMCDETFAINSGTRIPDDVDRGWFMLFVSMLNRWYWIAGTALGWLVGGLLPFSTRGIEFVLTALFLVIFLDQWMGTASGRAHVSGVIGVGATAACLALFGSSDFMIPSMALMLAVFLLLRRHLDETPSAPGGAGDDRGTTTAADAASDRAAADHGRMESDHAEVDHVESNHKAAVPRRDDERTAA
ncbi:branched-chain amino acid transport protein [Bifidobacterium sp. DSM 109958]|uniref:Branched-chain amino acid transport protein n=1 Tax=Bifidobacterium moraviense TaxID=2675323 RepID=A0A7Y0F3M0_9BIFI|nr:AzlC family ABC transporter permease [Bifidobacterium sp. DSM 109958]NMN01331.1 branched-chain amino acid transport protein [Bifidobacterium sp. DSM 109958]